MADTISPAKDISEYFADNGIGTLGTDLFYHNMPKEPKLMISVMDSGGFDPNLFLDPTNQEQNPTIQVRVRGNKYGFDEAYQKIKQCVDLIDQKFNLEINSTRYISIHVIGNINDLGEDTNECPILTVNFRLCAAGI